MTEEAERLVALVKMYDRQIALSDAVVEDLKAQLDFAHERRAEALNNLRDVRRELDRLRGRGEYGGRY